MQRKILTSILIFLPYWFVFCFLVFFVSVTSVWAAPSIGNIQVVTGGQIEKYAKFEISFTINNTTAINFYFPYDANPPARVERISAGQYAGKGTGITAEALFLAPNQTNWTNAKILPCFYYQPVEELGSGGDADLLPKGKPDWRCRFAPEKIGTWEYRIQVSDAGGTSYSPTYQFIVIESNSKGFIKVSQVDSRFFEFSNGEPFVYPLVNIEEGNPFNSVASLRTNIQKLGGNGVRFVRWFPTGEGANMEVSPFSDNQRYYWKFGETNSQIDDVDQVMGNKFSWSVHYYSAQLIPARSGAKYRLKLRAKVVGEQVLRVEIGNLPGGRRDFCSASNLNHSSCDYRLDGWQSYEVNAANSNNEANMDIGLRGLYVSSDAPSPYGQVRSGYIRVGDVILQRDESGSGDWGGNLLYHGSPDGYRYVDQIGAARLDAIFEESEAHNVYHKLTLFHKNDELLNRFGPDGSIGDWYQCEWGYCPNNFYAAAGQAARWYEDAYTRYFVARWSYSTALHSLELGNECDLYQQSYDAGWHLAELVHSLSPRRILMTNSFWGYYASDFFNDPAKAHLIDYDDKHWYASTNSSDQEVISNTWGDSAAYVRECWLRFQDYESWQIRPKPIVRGEGGVAVSGTQPQHPDIAQESTGTYYHKKLWAHVGILGHSCDGEWYPRIFVSGQAFPNSTYNLFKMFKAYENFMTGEPTNNGNYQEIGNDIGGVSVSNNSLRAWGVRDSVHGRVLLWIDNKNQTWRNPQAAGISGTVTIQGLPSGYNYRVERWNTNTGAIEGSPETRLVSDGTLSLSVSELKDVAYKLIAQDLFPSPSPTPNPACKADVNGDTKVDALDFIQVSTNWGKVSGFANTDINSDGKVNALDLGIVIKEWGCGN